MNLTSIIKIIFKDILYFIIGMIYIVVKVYQMAEKTFVKVFKLFPKWVIRIIVWVLLINIFVLNNKAPEIIEKIKTEIEIKEVYAVKEIMIEQKKCEYGIYECAIYDEALEQGLNENQAKISIAISQWETGHYTSSLFKNSNNIGGLYNSNAKKFYSYNSIEDGIEAYINNLKKGYFDKGLDTIEKIQTKYCPIGAENDPTGLNVNWTSGVTYYYNKL